MQSFEDFELKYNEGKSQILWESLSSDVETPISIALKFQDEDYFCMFESVVQGRNRGRYSIIATKPDLIWKCEELKPFINRTYSSNINDFNPDGEDALKSLRNLIDENKFDIPQELPSMSSGIFGYMGYDMVRLFEDISDNNLKTIDIPDSIFFRPRITIAFDSVTDEMYICSPIFYNANISADKAFSDAKLLISETIDKVYNTNISKSYIRHNNKANKNSPDFSYQSNTSREQYHEMVKKAKEYILQGDIFQVVPSQRFTVDFDRKPLSLYRSLRNLNPSPYSFFVKMDDFSLVGSSPEILVRCKDGRATVRPIAGTRKRGANKEEDIFNEKDLLNDQKEKAEHLMLIDLGRNDIGRIAKIGTVRVTEKMIVEHYSHVMHIVSNVEGEIRDDVDALDCVMAGFPVGTVSGAPKIRAMEIIDELEQEKRSFYAGGVGYFSSDGSVDTCIALRTGLVKDNKLYVQAGGGVVADSDPEAEYQESCNKAQALLKAAEITIQKDME